MNLLQIGALTEAQARHEIERIRWPEGAVCPFCKTKSVTKLGGKSAERGLYKCKTKECRKLFTAFKGTIFEDSKLTCRQWLHAFHLMCSSKKGVSALQLSRELGITYKSAWFVAHRFRWAVRQEPLSTLLGGEGKIVEADETWIGGKRKNMHAKKRRQLDGRGPKGKIPVVALVERNGRSRVTHVKRVTAPTLKEVIKAGVDVRSRLMTDEAQSYCEVGPEFPGHEVVNHKAGEYVRGDATTNTVESFFALLKRGIMGIFHHVSEKHLHRYCDEFSFRWDHRKTTDGERMEAALRLAEGKRLTYR